jgi:hypothetical protein
MLGERLASDTRVPMPRFGLGGEEAGRAAPTSDASATVRVCALPLLFD